MSTDCPGSTAIVESGVLAVKFWALAAFAAARRAAAQVRMITVRVIPTLPENERARTLLLAEDRATLRRNGVVVRLRIPAGGAIRGDTS